VTELALGLGLLVLVGFAAWRMVGVGRDVERGKQAEGSLDAVDKANAAKRDAARADDPKQQLRDDWRG
jgi:uncharacterized alpha-E superfamily protein